MQFVEVVGCVWKYVCVCGYLCGFGFLFCIGGFVVVGFWWCVDEVGQVIEVQVFGFQCCGQSWMVVVYFELKIVIEVVVVYFVGEVVVMLDVVVVFQVFV